MKFIGMLMILLGLLVGYELVYKGECFREMLNGLASFMGLGTPFGDNPCGTTKPPPTPPQPPLNQINPIPPGYPGNMIGSIPNPIPAGYPGNMIGYGQAPPIPKVNLNQVNPIPPGYPGNLIGSIPNPIPAGYPGNLIGSSSGSGVLGQALNGLKSFLGNLFGG